METEKHPGPALPLLALLALASALGIAVAIVLAGVAMLLAAPAYAQDGEIPDGSLLLERRSGLAPAKLLFAQTESHDDGHQRVVEAYHNPFDEPLVGIYLYRLPQSAELERLSFAPGAAVPQPALLTRRQGATLVERTAEIAPGGTLRVELEYRSRSPRRVLARWGTIAPSRCAPRCVCGPAHLRLPCSALVLLRSSSSWR